MIITRLRRRGDSAFSVLPMHLISARGIGPRMPGRELGAGADVEFGKDVGEVEFDRLRRNREMGGDLAVGHTGGDECDEVSCVLAKYVRPCCERFKPKQADIAPRTANGVPEELDKTMVRAGVEKVKPRVVACGEKAGTKGTVKIAVTVAPEGNVTAASVASSPDSALGECVAAAMKNAVFGKSVNGGSFTYPFVF